MGGAGRCAHSDPGLPRRRFPSCRHLPDGSARMGDGADWGMLWGRGGRPAGYSRDPGKPGRPLVGVWGDVGAQALAWARWAVTDTVPVVRGLEAFDRFYAREFPKMVNVAYALSGSRMAAEDLAQEAMVVAYRRWPEVGVLERPGGWVRRVVLNLAASGYQRRKAEARALLRLAPLRGEPPAVLSDRGRRVLARGPPPPQAPGPGGGAVLPGGCFGGGDRRRSWTAPRTR